MIVSPRERLTRPLIRENGGHRPASWDEALDRFTKGFQTQIAKYGPDAFGMFSCSKTSNELNYAAQKLVRAVIGCNHIDGSSRNEGFGIMESGNI